MLTIRLAVLIPIYYVILMVLLIAELSSAKLESIQNRRTWFDDEE